MYFETDRLYTREFEMEDFDEFHDMQSSLKVMKYIIGRGRSKEENRSELKSIIHDYKKDDIDKIIMAISIKNERVRTLAGSCAIGKNENEAYEVGYRLSEKYWGKGYGAEILNGLLNFSLDVIGVSEVVSIVDKENIYSINILEQSPMEFVKEYKDKANQIVRLYKLEKQAQHGTG